MQDANLREQAQADRERIRQVALPALHSNDFLSVPSIDPDVAHRLLQCTVVCLVMCAGPGLHADTHGFKLPYAVCCWVLNLLSQTLCLLFQALNCCVPSAAVFFTALSFSAISLL